MKNQIDHLVFAEWTGNRDIQSLGTNAGARSLPFQGWRRFKEAFAPELIARAIHDSPGNVGRCVDPFAGSGTTGLACQFLGVHPVVAEVNPYLADLIEAKLDAYPSAEILDYDLATVIGGSVKITSSDVHAHFASAPATFVEPGVNGRWIFDERVAERIVALLDEINQVEEPARRLFRVLLGGILVEASNVVVSGKGRRYRANWKGRIVDPNLVTELFQASAQKAIDDIRRFAGRPVISYEIIRGDSRFGFSDVDPCQLAVFSPPYPNSADYTDIYNVELWTLGYLNGREDDSTLRSATLSSHVQGSRQFADAPSGSGTLQEVLGSLHSRRSSLWDHRIPSMVGAYFSDLLDVLAALARILSPDATAWIVVGDSRYAGVLIPVGTVLQELVEDHGWEVLSTEPFRSMRTSAQQGGDRMLTEQLLVLRKAR